MKLHLLTIVLAMVLVAVFAYQTSAVPTPDLTFKASAVPPTRTTDTNGRAFTAPVHP